MDTYYSKENPFDFAFANKHGDIQVKLRKRFKNKSFFGITDYECFQNLMTDLSVEDDAPGEPSRFHVLKSLEKSNDETISVTEETTF